MLHHFKIEIEIVHNMCRQTGPTVVSRATLLCHSGLGAPAGGAAAAAPEGGALVGPSAPTSTSTRWALVTP